MRQTRSSSQSDVRDLLIPCLETEELAWQQAFQHGDGEVCVCVCVCMCSVTKSDSLPPHGL